LDEGYKSIEIGENWLTLLNAEEPYEAAQELERNLNRFEIFTIIS